MAICRIQMTYKMSVYVAVKDLKRNPENRISVVGTKSGFTSLANKIQSFSFSSMKLHKNTQMSGKINLHIYLMLNVYKTFHQTAKYGHQRNQILQDLTMLGLKFKFL